MSALEEKGARLIAGARGALEAFAVRATRGVTIEAAAEEIVPMLVRHFDVRPEAAIAAIKVAIRIRSLKRS